MLISFLTLTILFLFELIVCDKLEAKRSIPSWSICFTPLFILSIVSIIICIWSIRYDKSYEIELFFSLNILQFVFIALRLDSTITWSWILVLIPVWIIMSIAMIILLYMVILTIVMRRNNQNLINHNHHHKSKHKWSHVLFYAMFIFSLLSFEILLSNKLDQDMASTNLFDHLNSIINLQQHQLLHQQTQQNQHQQHQQSATNFIKSHYYPNHINSNYKNYPLQHVASSIIGPPSPASSLATTTTLSPQLSSTSPSIVFTSLTSSSKPNVSPASRLSFFAVTIPLYFTYFSLICLSFNSHSGNGWWFGMRRDFCEYFLFLCPIFQIYGNIQIKLNSSSGRFNDNQQQDLLNDVVVVNNNNNSNTRSNVNNNNTNSNDNEASTGGQDDRGQQNRSGNRQQRQTPSSTDNILSRNYQISNETSLMTFNFNQNQNNSANMDDESALIGDAGDLDTNNPSVSMGNPLSSTTGGRIAGHMSSASSLSNKNRSVNSSSINKNKKRSAAKMKENLSLNNRQFSIPSYISNYSSSDRASLKSLYLLNQINNSSSGKACSNTNNNSKLNGKNVKVGKIVLLDQPD